MTDFFTTLIGALIGSGVGAAAVSGLFQRDKDKRNRSAAVSDAAHDAVAYLDIQFRAVADGGTEAAALPDPEARARASVDKCADDALSAVFDEWQTFGRAFASGDPDSGEEEYSEKLSGVRQGLRATAKGTLKGASDT